MKVFELMTAAPGVCRPDDNLTRAAEIMWQRDCGIVPVVGADHKIVGVITDRDICIATATRDRAPSQIRASEMYLREPVTCETKDDLKDVLKKMRKHQIKRLLVTDRDGALIGVVSLSDIVTKAGDKKSTRKALFKTLEAVSSPAPIVLRETDDDDEDGPDEPRDERGETDKEAAAGDEDGGFPFGVESTAELV